MHEDKPDNNFEQKKVELGSAEFEQDLDPEIKHALEEYVQLSQSQQMLNPDDFWNSLNEKLSQEEELAEIKQANNAIKQDYIIREQKLSKLKDFTKKKNNKRSDAGAFKIFSTKSFIALSLTCLALASIANFQYKEDYNYIATQYNGIVWSDLNLDNAQRKSLKEIDKSWYEFRKEQTEDIEALKKKLETELSQKQPKMGLVDKYHRDILDHEILLKRKESSIFLEKRFVLNEEQTLKLIEMLKN